MSIKDMRIFLEQCCMDDIKYLKEKQKKYIFDKLINQVKSELPKKEEIDKEKIINDKVITIYQTEIDKIQELNNVDLEKVAFVLLVYCKWLDNIQWFNILKSDLFSEAKVNNLNSEIKQNLLSKLFELGYAKSDVIKIDKRHCRGLKDAKRQMWNLTYIESNSEGKVAFQINDYYNFVFRYLNYVYGGYFECAKCNKIYKQNEKRNRVFCRECIKYQSMDTKIIKCKDCGEKVIINSLDNSTKRCKYHQSIHEKQLKKERNKNYYNKQYN